MANEQNLVPFTKGDTRINRNGRPKNLDAMREMARELGYEPVDIRKDEEAMTYIEAIFRDWMKSKNFHKQLAFIQYAFGKVPDKLEVNREGNRVIIEWQDGDELEAESSKLKGTDFIDELEAEEEEGEDQG